VAGYTGIGTITRLVVLALATFRLAKLIQQDGITARFRDALIGRSEFAYELLGCQMCVGVWSAGIVILLRNTFLVDLLAIAGAQVFLYGLCSHIERVRWREDAAEGE